MSKSFVTISFAVIIVISLLIIGLAKGAIIARPPFYNRPLLQSYIQERKLQSKKDCPKGYKVAGSPGLTYEPEYYCKIDKEWPEFASCRSQSDCSGGYRCRSIGSQAVDYRCIPPEHYQTDCSCEPETGCACY